MNAQEFSSREKGLLKVASNKKWENVRLENKLEADQQFILSLIAKGRSTEDDVWEWVSINKFCLMVMSDVFGEYTDIQDYTKKDGSIIKAHFWGNIFRGTLKQLGDKPVGVLAKFRITREKFTYKAGGSTLEELFIPVGIDDDDIPLSQLRRV
jgi:hypothetical protein